MSPDWDLTALILAEDHRLPVVAEELAIGDEVIVPQRYADRVESLAEETSGLMERAFGKETVERTRSMIKRVLSSEDSKGEAPAEEEKSEESDT